ncbi:MAG: MFS transporter [Chloroflexi bacterium]|nr:MFS transporter [Chloroflexota bacterium]
MTSTPKGRLFLAFRAPAYRWLWSSQFLDVNGLWSFMLAQGWLILELTDSPLMVGLAPGVSGVVNLVSSSFGGVLADRLNRRTLLIVCQGTVALIILALGLLTVTGLVQVWHILLAATLQGISRGLQGPVRNSLMYDVVGRQAVMHAMAGVFLAGNAAKVIGPLGAGFLIGAFGAGPVFLGVSGFLFLATLLLLPLPHPTRPLPTAGSLWENFAAGLSFALHDRPIRTVMWVIPFTEGLGFGSQTMFPVVARDMLHAGPVTLGLLSASWGIGAVVATIALSSLGFIKPKGWVFMGATFGFGLLLLAFSFSRLLPLSLALLFVVGGFGVTYDTMGSTLLQTMAPDTMRGRIMGLYGVATSGFSLGAFTLGAMANVWGVAVAIAIGGGVVSANVLRMAPVARIAGERSAVPAALLAEADQAKTGRSAAPE